MRRVKCLSGLIGWRQRLQKNYNDFDTFAQYDEIYSLSSRLGFSSTDEAWIANPVIEGSVIPSDFRKVRD